MEEMAGSGKDGIVVLQVGGLHGVRLSSDTVFLSFEEDSDTKGVEEVFVQGILWNNAVFVVEMHVPEAELECVPV